MSARGATGGPICKEVRERLVLHYYGADEDGASIDLHLESCRACAASWTDTVASLRAIEAREMFPLEGGVDWPAFARMTVARARAAEREGRALAVTSILGRVRVPRTLWQGALLAAAAALVVVAGFVWRAHGPGPVSTETTPGIAAVNPEGTRFLQQSVTRRAAARSLRDGRALLVDLMQAPVRCRRSDGSYDVALEKARANDLLRRMNLYQGSLAGPGDVRLNELLGQLESLLLQVSSMDDCTAGQAIHDLRAAIERRQILLRIDLVTREVEEGGSRA